MYKYRYCTEPILKDLGKKLVFISGPRQAGKTTLARHLSDVQEYINYDSSEDRLIILRKTWNRDTGLVIFDELHKMKNWKSWLKGVYDTEGVPPAMLVTGSAKLDIYRKMGDSLAGRFFHYRLHPFDLKELHALDPAGDIEKMRDRLLSVGGFPEPYLDGRRAEYNRWKKTNTDIIIRQDLLDLESVRNISVIETLIELLRTRVGSTVSYASLARDLNCDNKSIQRWLNILERMYVIFRLTPFSRKIARSLLKEPKFYFYDIGLVKGDIGQKLENLVAASIIKELNYLEDSAGRETGFYFLRSKDGREVDFYVTVDERKYLIEVKSSDDTPSPHFRHFAGYFPGAHQVQLVNTLSREKTYPGGVEIRALAKWLSRLTLIPPSSKPL